MKLKSKLLPLLLSLTVIFSFSVMGASTNLAAANSKEPLKVPKRSSHTSTYDPKDGNLVIITAGTTANLPEGKNAQVFYPDSSSGSLTTRLKIKPKHSGYILFTCKASNKIKLCDSKGHDMSSWRKVYGNSEIDHLRKVAFGVKGGQNYYDVGTDAGECAGGDQEVPPENRNAVDDLFYGGPPSGSIGSGPSPPLSGD